MKELDHPKCVIRVEKAHGNAFIHCDWLDKWNCTNYTKALIEWDNIVVDLMQQDIDHVYAAIPRDSTTEMFAAMFGFTETDTVSVNADGSHSPIYEYEIRG